MDGSGFDSFDKAADILKSTSNAAKSTFGSAVKTTGQQMIGNQQAGVASEGNAFETNSTTSPRSQTPKTSPLDPSQVAKQNASDQEKLAKARQDLQSLHMTKYFNPTFIEKPKEIKAEREQQWNAKNQQETQKKVQMEDLQVEKRKEYQQIAMDKKAKGEIGKVGSG